MNQNLEKYNDERYQKYQNPEKFSENGFWRIVKKVGAKVAEQAILAYCVMKDPATPTKAKMIIAGALAYLILPFDVVPDFFPVVGFADDLGVICGALMQIAVSIKPKHHEETEKICLQLGFSVKEKK